MADDKTALEREIQEKLEQPPEANPVRNINYDVHLGHAAQRPYARLEDQLAPLSGYRSFEDMAKAVEAAGDGPMYKGDDGDWYHKNKKEAAGMTREVDGKIERAMVARPRRVALTKEAAIAASDAGAPTDYHNGFSWVWNGKKSARDTQVMAQMASEPQKEDLEWEPLDSMAQVEYRAQQSRRGESFHAEPAKAAPEKGDK